MSKSVDNDIFTQHPALKNLLRVLTICKGFVLYFASCNTVALRESLVETLKEKLQRPILELSLDPNNNLPIAAQAEELIQQADESAVLFIYGLEKLYYLKDRHIMQELQWHRERYGRLKRPLVFWLPDFLITEIFHEAPDFMDWRSGIYEFSLPQHDKKTLIANTFKSGNEHFVEQLTLAEKQRWIVNLENLLTELSEENSNTRHELLNRLGQLYYSIGNYDKALLCYQQNLPLCQVLADKKNEGATLGNIATIYLAKANYDTALNYLEQSLKIVQEIGDKQGKGATLNNISQIYYAKSDYSKALSYLEQSLKIQQEINDKQGEGIMLNNISQIYDAKGDYDTTLNYLEQALKIAQEIGDKQGEGAMLNNISQIYYAKSDYSKALSYLEQSLKIQQEINDKQGEGITLNNISQIYDAKGDYDTTLNYLEQALKIAQEIGDLNSESVTLFNLGYLHEAKGNQSQALSCWKQSYQIAKKIGAAQILQNLEKLAKDLGGNGLDFWEKLSE